MPTHSSSAAPAVFINCPFDPSYRPLFEAIVFAVMVLRFEPRCALERDTGTEERLKKIVELIRSSQFGIHDLSFMHIDRATKLPRYNMAFELGLFLGCCELGGKAQKGKSCLILDRERWRYRKSLSDLSGRDIQEHKNDPQRAIAAVRNWLATEAQVPELPGGSFILKDYKRFRKALPALCRRAKLQVRELSFTDYRVLIATWLRASA